MNFWKILKRSPLNATPTASDTKWAVTVHITVQYHFTAIHGSSLSTVKYRFWINLLLIDAGVHETY